MVTRSSRRTRVLLLALLMLSSMLPAAVVHTSVARADDPPFASADALFENIENINIRLYNTTSVAWGDVDSDGDLDLVLGNKGQSQLYRNESGTLTLDTTWKPDSYNTTSVAWGDVDSDGDLDLVLGNDGQSQLYRNQGGTLTFDSTWKPAPATTASVAWGDVDGDGDLDLVLGNTSQPSQLYRNQGGTLTLDPTWNPAPANTRSVAWGDIDGDGDLDLVLGNENQPSQLYRNQNGTLTLDKSWKPAPASTYSMAWGDVDGDGDLDLVLGNENQSSQLYRNQNGTLTLDTIWNPAPASTYSVAWGDVDGDGDLDLVLGNSSYFDINSGGYNGQPSQLYRNQNGTLTRDTTWQPVPADIRSVALADVDGDGALDLMLGSNGEYSSLYINQRSKLTLDPTWNSPSAYAWSVAWGDVDGDGDLDLALGSLFGPSQLYRNEGGTLTLDENWQPASVKTASVAWGDVDGDGDLDLALGNNGQPSQLYRNEGGTLTLDTTWNPAPAYTWSVAWGDVDGDGDLDLALGNGGQSSQLYRNEGGTLTLDANWNPDPVDTWSVAWGDVDGDGDLDLALGNSFGPGQLYRNQGGTLTLDTTWKPVSVNTRSVAWGDVDGDGDLDLAVGNLGQPSQLYRNQNGTLMLDTTWKSASNYTYSVAWGDVDGDGDLDLALGNENQPSQLYRNEGGTLTLDTTWKPASTTTRSVAWGDVDGDGDLDLALGDPVFSSHLYRNPRTATASGPAQVQIGQPVTAPPLRGANGYATASILTGPRISVPYTLKHPTSQPVGRVIGQYSLDGGGSWQTAVATTDTVTTTLDTSPSGTAHTFTWDTFASGVFGQSDNVVFRLIVLPDLRSHPNQISGLFLYGNTAAATLPFRLRGAQVRVVPEPPPVIAPNPTQTNRVLLPFVVGGYSTPRNGVADALVYRLPKGQTRGAQPFRLPPDASPFRTNSRGYLAGHQEFAVGDQLIALQEITQTEKYTLYNTNAAPTPSGLDAFTVKELGVQTLTISSKNPLLALNLAISLEWDARKDTQFLSQLRADLQRTAELLYDWSDGQITLGALTIYQDKQEWDAADIRIYATNRLRPNATLGGISPVDRTDPYTSTTSYEPGHIRIGTSWSRFVEPGQTFAEDWPRALAHELGHYALYLDEDYLGLNDNGQLIEVTSCPSPMSDPYRDDYSEFHPDAGWQMDCASTLANRNTGRSDWATIQRFYGNITAQFQLHQPPSYNANPGPSVLPLAITTIEEVTPEADDTTLATPFFTLSGPKGGRYEPGPNARAFLFSGDGNRITDLGKPVVDQVRVRGVHPDDRLCVFDSDASNLGCETVSTSDNGLNLGSVPQWHPELIVTPVTSRTLQIVVPAAGVGTPAPPFLAAQIFPLEEDAAGGDASDPVVNITLVLEGDQYRGTITTATTPILQGYVHVWAEGDTQPRREVVTDFSLGGNPAPPQHVSKLSRRKAPAVSPDGQLVLYADGIDFKPGEFYSIQTATALPSPPSWATVVGQGYRVLASNPAPSLSSVSLNMSYAESDVPLGEEKNLQMYFWNGQVWKPLQTVLNTERNEASARAEPVSGLYVLMTSAVIPLPQVGWNLVYFYPGATQPVTDALASITGSYTTVYGYNEQDTSDPWKLYDTNVPTWVNDLDKMTYGQGYWINTTQAITLSVKGGIAGTNQVSAGILSAPPSTYYGVLNATSDFTPAEGVPVVARVGTTVCGTTQTRTVAGQVVFAVDVAAAGTGELANCGTPGKPVTITIGSYTLPAVLPWDNSRPRGI